jgi:hypothetical protein
MVFIKPPCIDISGYVFEASGLHCEEENVMYELKTKFGKVCRQAHINFQDRCHWESYALNQLPQDYTRPYHLLVRRSQASHHVVCDSQMWTDKYKVILLQQKIVY